MLTSYYAYWTDLLAASDPANPRNPRLAAHATGKELDRAKAVVGSRKKAGEVVRGTYSHQAVVGSVSDAKATVNDCLTLSTKVFDAKTQKQKKVDPPGPFPVAVTMTKSAGVWKVSDIGSGQVSCTTIPLPSHS